MTADHAIALGLLQGLTEFLPVSSSGHLALARQVLGSSGADAGITFEVMLHLGTALAIVTVYWRKLLALAAAPLRPGPDRHQLLLVIVATLPIGVVGLGLKDVVEQAFDSVAIVCVCLMVTGAFLVATLRLRPAEGQIGMAAALLIGVAQAAAIMPGISRSGATIAMALFLGVARERAAEFSLVIGVVAIAGATVLELRELAAVPALGPLIAGTLVAYLSGLAAIWVLLGALRTGRFALFGFYCWGAGLVGLGTLV